MFPKMVIIENCRCEFLAQKYAKAREFITLHTGTKSQIVVTLTIGNKIISKSLLKHTKQVTTQATRQSHVWCFSLLILKNSLGSPGCYPRRVSHQSVSVATSEDVQILTAVAKGLRAVPTGGAAGDPKKNTAGAPPPHPLPVDFFRRAGGLPQIPRWKKKP